MKLNQELIKKLAAGEIAVKNDGTLGQLREVLKAAFPNYKNILVGERGYYFKFSTGYWHCDDSTSLPSHPISDFYTEDQPEFERGELVVVKDQFIGDDEFLVGKYVAYIKNAKHPHVFTAKDADIDNPDFKFEIYVSSDVRKLDAKVNVTLQEIAKWKNCPVDQIVII